MTINYLIKAAAMCAILTAFTSVPASAKPKENAMPDKFSVLVTFGEEECPEAEGDEIVVCANQPESERYRIPKELRKTEEELAVDHSWASTVDLHEDAARAGRPNSCSVVGTNGFSGCQAAALRQWFAERRGQEN